ncbi:60S ribosomal protein L24 [Intoshia linei]|uniref:Large ribosomal subunit protein eL24 n=1 Tax=Intoshia linei TaxID=1819745 RepID=A0A177B957_9BILA|nr:60S ribosomal protein L24 [Intoshia linei]
MEFKTDICVYSGFKIYPGHGKRIIKIDGKVLNFITNKCMRLQEKKKNPRDVRWTVYYRRKHKKDARDDHKRRRARVVVKTERGVQGASLVEIVSKRQEKPEIRKAQRDQAISDAKKKKINKANEKKKQKSSEQYSKKYKKQDKAQKSYKMKRV